MSAIKVGQQKNILQQFGYLIYIIQNSGPVAQRLEQWTHNPLVVGSNPTGPSQNGDLTIAIEGCLFAAFRKFWLIRVWEDLLKV